jgi:superfamily I DNA/RNA helicase/mRNA-degrading endonuclease RelE of RelBE toxin-antitoxin system
MSLKVAFSDGYFSALNKLQPVIQSKVNQMIMKLMSNPDLPGLNLEKLKVVKDNSFRSIRVDQAYRVILSAQSNVLLLLWVDHHDDAYKWAETHKCNINAETGAIQLYQTETKLIETESEKQDPNAYLPELFRDLKDKQLMKLGVPEDHIVKVRPLKTEAQLDQLQGFLPDEAYEGLFLILAGQSYEEILAERDINQEAQFNTEDFGAALERFQTLSKFSVVSGEDELKDVLSASLEKWRVFLHPSQRRLATGVKNGSVRVLGGAGTGKTVVAMHRAKWLAQNALLDGQKVLFTTFTKNLAQDIEDNLKVLCGNDLVKKIEVVNLDRWVSYFLRKHHYDFEVVYNQQTLDSLWQQAYSEMPASLDLSLAFFKEEWQQVVQPQSINSIDDYKKAKRIGRGTRLNRRQKLEIWQVFEVYRRLLNQHGYKEVHDAYRDAADFIQNNQVDLPYASIVVDEAQDMGSQAFRLLRAIVPEGQNDLFIVGDAHQRIYGQNKVILGQLGINIRGRSSKLKINYRTTDEIRKYATSVLIDRPVDDLDGGEDDNTLYKSLTHGDSPVHNHFDSAEQQARFLADFVKTTEIDLQNICITARTNNEINQIRSSLEASGIKTFVVNTSEADGPENAVRLATVHRVKGLEFDIVFLASCNEGLFPLSYAMQNKGDDISYEQAEAEERSLMYVALTRAKKAVYVTSYGRESIFLLNT